MLKGTTKLVPKKVKKSLKKTNHDIFRFIDFFVKTGEKVLGAKPTVIRGKDGRLVSSALKKLPVAKLETLAVWFLARKRNLRPLIATMLSNVVLEELLREMNTSSFWKETNELMDQYYPRISSPRLWQPFSHGDINDMKEQIAKAMRKTR